MKIKKENTVLLIVDLQAKLLSAIDCSDELIESNIKLIKGCQLLGVPVIVSEQYPKGLGNTVGQIAGLLPNIAPIEKQAFSCLENTELKSKLQALGRRNVIVAGVEAHVCVQQTVLDLIDADFKPIVITNCIASRFKQDKKVAIKRMTDYGSDFTTYEGILFELLVTANAPEFKQISAIIK